MSQRSLGFDHESHPELEKIRRRYFSWHLLVDFVAGLTFVAGSALFFWDSLHTSATWCFLVGSVMFAAKPTIRLAHQIHRARLGRQLARAVDQHTPDLSGSSFSPR